MQYFWNRQGLHSNPHCGENAARLVFIGGYNIIAGFQWGSSAFYQVDTERCFHNLFTMLQASEIVCKIIFCLSSTTVQIGQNPSMFDIHVISCCALRVDSTCCCLALHTIWNLFTSSSVIWWPSSTTDGTVWAVSLVYIVNTVSTVSKWWQTLWDPEKISETYLFKIRCVYFLMWENKSSYPLNISVEEFDLSCFFFLLLFFNMQPLQS